MEEHEQNEQRGWSVRIDLRDAVAVLGAVAMAGGAAMIHVGAAVMLAGAGTVGLALYFVRRG